MNKANEKWFVVKQIFGDDGSLCACPEGRLIKVLEQIGVTETTGCSEMFEDGWVKYVGDDNRTIWAKPITTMQGKTDFAKDEQDAINNLSDKKQEEEDDFHILVRANDDGIDYCYYPNRDAAFAVMEEEYNLGMEDDIEEDLQEICYLGKDFAVIYNGDSVFQWAIIPAKEKK